MIIAQRLFLVLAHFVCPLVFFTNLTRNPYITQICLLNIALAWAAAVQISRGVREPAGVKLPRTPLDYPWLATLLVCALSWTVAYLGHARFFRPAILSEGGRNAVFLNN
ncbi:MAG: hypothetical protein WC881_09440, partial [Elusimicrobiota bacterium]